MLTPLCYVIVSKTSVPPENCSTFTEDTLLRHAQFLVEQVKAFHLTHIDLLFALPYFCITICLKVYDTINYCNVFPLKITGII